MRALTLAEVLVHGSGVERPCLCPVHEDTNPSASVNMLKKVWVCYSCGASGKLRGEALLAEPDYAKLAQMFHAKAQAIDRTYPETWLNRFDAGPVHPYWIDRFSEEAARHFRLGYDHETDAVTYPLRKVNGEVLGVVRRSLNPEDDWKYRYPPGVDVSRLLFGYTPEHRVAVVLVEGALDAIALWMVGIEAFAIYGARLSEHQVQLIDRLDPTHVITCFDNDRAGYTAHRATEIAFGHRMVSRLTWPLSWGKDIDDLSLDRREEVCSVLLKRGLACVECSSWTTSSPSTSKPGGLRIVPRSA